MDVGTTQEQLDLEYIQVGWRDYGFSFDAFLRWRVMDSNYELSIFRNFRKMHMSDLEGKAIDDKILVDIQNPDSVIEDESPRIWDEFRLRMVRPEWADSWAEEFHGPGDAVPWAMLGMELDDVEVFQSLRFRKAKRAV